MLDLEVTLGRMSARAGKGTGRATVGGELACQAELLFVLVDAPAAGAVDSAGGPNRPAPV